MVAKSSGNFPSNHEPAHRNPFIMSFIALYEEIKHSDLQKIRATRRGTQAQLLAIVDTLAIFGVSWKLFPQYIKDLHIHTIGARNKQ